MTTPAPAQPVAAPEPNRRVLIIDDNRAIHEDFRKILAPSGTDAALVDAEAALFGDAADPATPAATSYPINSAYQGQEALQMVEQALADGRPYALAFVDMRMPPGWDGLETIERLRDADPLLQFVICTAYSDYSWEDLARRLGATDRVLILKKPFDNAEARQVAAALTEKWNLARLAAQHVDGLEGAIRARTAQLEESNTQLRAQIEQREALEVKLVKNATHDALTGLPNRAALMERMAECRQRALRLADYRFAVLFLDLDDFKVINDSLGHVAGDELLVEVARRLTAAVPGSDLADLGTQGVTARLGGDEFVILLERLRSPDDAVRVAERVQQRLAAPCMIAGHEMVASASIGIALGEPEGGVADDLLRNADTAMYRAKMSGKRRYAIFDQAMHTAVSDRLQLENELRKALERDQLELHYQPIVRLESGRLLGFEALIRWRHPQRGLISPLTFIPLAEETRLINPIGQWVIEQACENLAKWRQIPGYADLHCSVNVSRVQLREDDLVDQVHQALLRNRLDPAALCIEITESVVMTDSAVILDRLRRLKDLGAHIHLDDFGTGLSSLSCLHQYPIHVVKIDKSFTRNASEHREYAAVVQAVATLAHNLGIDVTVEGVETVDMVAQLLALDCDYGQGYYFAKPLPLDAATALLTTGGQWKLTA